MLRPTMSARIAAIPRGATASQLLRNWAQERGSYAAAERLAGVPVGTLRMWFHQPGRRFSPDTGRKVAAASGIPFVALMFRDEPVRSLVRSADPGVRLAV